MFYFCNYSSFKFDNLFSLKLIAEKHFFVITNSEYNFKRLDKWSFLKNLAFSNFSEVFLSILLTPRFRDYFLWIEYQDYKDINMMWQRCS